MNKHFLGLVFTFFVSQVIYAQYAEPIQWENIDMVEVITSPNQLQKNANNGIWNDGASSIQKIQADKDGYVEWTTTATNKAYMMGLSLDHTGSWNGIDFALYNTYSGGLMVYENGASRGSFGSYAAGDVMRVAKEGTTITFSKNGTVFYTSTVTIDPAQEYFVSTAVYSSGTIIDDPVIFTGATSEPFVVQNGHLKIGGDQEHVIIENSGNVGIGVELPSEKLEVAGNIKSEGLRINTTTTSGGYVSIGEAAGTGTSTSYDMVVNGHLGVHKLHVDINDTWGDFVFSEGYPLMPLNEVEKFIGENSHLPEFPSAEKVESSGVDMAEIVRLQTIKIEELTLHLIQLNKRIEELEKE